MILRYHPFLSLKSPKRFYGLTASDAIQKGATLSHFKFDYVFDMMLLLKSEYRKGKLICSMCRDVEISDLDILAATSTISKEERLMNYLETF